MAEPAPAASLTVGHAVAGTWLPRTQTWLYEQIKRLPAHVRSHVFCEATENLDQFPFPDLHTPGRGRGQRLDRLLRRLRLRRHFGFVADGLRAVGARLLHSHFGWVGWQNCRLTPRLGLRHAVTFYGLDVNYLPRQGWGPKYRELFDRVDLVLCEGPHMGRCIAQLGCEPRKIRVHHLGVAVGDIAYRPRTWSGGPLRFLIAGSFREKKGIPIAIAALARIKADVDLEITVIGDAASEHEQPEKQRILDAIAAGGLADRTRLLGFQPHARLFEEAYRHHVFVAASVTASSGDTEGGAPVTLIEMAASGMPIASTRHCDIPGVVLDGVTGLLADERDVDGLAAVLRRLAEHPAAWAPMVAAGRAHVEREFDSGRQGERLAAVYAELVAAR